MTALRSAALALAVFGAAPLAVAQSAGGVYVEQASDLVGASPDAVGVVPGGMTAAEVLAATVPPLTPGTNAVVLVQDGDDNRADISQTGTDNRFALVQQGVGNEVTADILGSGNTTNVTQLGDGNSYDLLMATDDLTLLPVVQEGTGNQAFQIVAPGLQPAGIEQRGNGMEVVVERNY